MSQNGISEENLFPNKLRVHYKFPEGEFEAEGNVEDVNEHTKTFIMMLNHPSTVISSEATLSVQENKPLSANNSLSGSNGMNNTHLPISLVEFYTDTACDATGISDLGQREQILAITWYLSEHEGKSLMTLHDYQQAYLELAEIPVTLPNNLTARLSENVKAGLLVKSKDGYKLTVRGKQQVRELLQLTSDNH
jgi:hypothetical protein